MSQPQSDASTSKPFAIIWDAGVDAMITSDTIAQDKAAVLAYLRLRHKDPLRGHILCCVVSAANLTLHVH